MISGTSLKWYAITTVVSVLHSFFAYMAFKARNETPFRSGSPLSLRSRLAWPCRLRRYDGRVVYCLPRMRGSVSGLTAALPPRLCAERHRLLEGQDEPRGSLDAHLLQQLHMLGASAGGRFTHRSSPMAQQAARRPLHVVIPSRAASFSHASHPPSPLQIIIFLKLLDGNTSQLILMEMGVSTFIEGWKVSKILRQRGMWGIGCVAGCRCWPPPRLRSLLRCVLLFRRHVSCLLSSALSQSPRVTHSAST